MNTLNEKLTESRLLGMFKVYDEILCTLEHLQCNLDNSSSQTPAYVGLCLSAISLTTSQLSPTSFSWHSCSTLLPQSVLTV